MAILAAMRITFSHFFKSEILVLHIIIFLSSLNSEPFGLYIDVHGGLTHRI